jgi:CRISPR-associated exonuclease Cas4
VSGEAIGLLILLALVAWGFLFSRPRPPSDGDDAALAGLPNELAGAELVYAEQTFRSTEHGLVAKLDRAYRINGEIKLVELKTRGSDQTFRTDLIELSVQRLALQEEAREVVSQTAWVIVQNNVTGVRRPHLVRLMSTEEVADLKSRYVAIVEGTLLKPEPAGKIKQCKACGHRDRCAAQFHDR